MELPDKWTYNQVNERLDKFKAFLSERGAEVLPSAGDELVRFRTQNGTSVIYHYKGGVSFYHEAEEAWLAYRTGAAKWRANVVPKRKPSYQDIPAIVERDGELCFFCQRKVHLDNKEGSVEHLVSRTHGGPNHLSNKYLAHKDCNVAVGHLSAPEKIKLHTEAMIRRVLEETGKKIGIAI